MRLLLERAPDRLKLHISQMNPPKEKPIYFKNCDFKFGFMGSLEILSEKALEMFFESGDQCTDKIGHDGGEDFYMMTCMDALGVYSMQDVELLSDKYTTGEHLILDEVTFCTLDCLEWQLLLRRVASIAYVFRASCTAEFSRLFATGYMYISPGCFVHR